MICAPVPKLFVLEASGLQPNSGFLPGSAPHDRSVPGRPRKRPWGFRVPTDLLSSLPAFQCQRLGQFRTCHILSPFPIVVTLLVALASVTTRRG